MGQRLHHTIIAALKGMDRPDGYKCVTTAPTNAARPKTSSVAPSLAALLRRQIYVAYARLHGVKDPSERRAQLRVIGEMQKHLQRATGIRAACS